MHPYSCLLWVIVIIIIRQNGGQGWQVRDFWKKVSPDMRITKQPAP